jgi:predicted nucleic acid-binding protein
MYFFDTSALIPLFDNAHVHTAPSSNSFHSLRTGERACSQHSLAEVFNTLTKSSYPSRATAPQANEFLAYLSQQLSIVPLVSEDYLQAAAVLAGLGRGGPLIYDALILQAARKIHAVTIYTWNVRDFTMLAPDLADRIRTP